MKPRKCASLVYRQDLYNLAKDSRIKEASLRPHDEHIGKGQFGEVKLATYTNKVGLNN